MRTLQQAVNGLEVGEQWGVEVYTLGTNKELTFLGEIPYSKYLKELSSLFNNSNCRTAIPCHWDTKKPYMWL